MKKIFLGLSLIVFLFSASAQSDTTSVPSRWTKGGAFGANFNQATLNNWAAGGVSSVSGTTYLSLIADYKTEKVIWQNTIELGYGLIKEDGESQRKSEDRIVFTSNYGRKIKGENKWYYSAALDFRTQFEKGYDPENPTEYISKFMAPGYLITTLGLDWRPNEYFTLSVSPFAGKFTFVNDQRLSDAGAYGVDPGESLRSELGGSLKATFNKEIFKNGQFTSNLLLFSNYSENPEKIDVNWENILIMKINNVLSANIYNQIIYDYDIKFNQEFDANGDLTSEEEKVQFKNILGLGLTYKFGGSRG